MNNTPFDKNIVEYCLDIFKYCKHNENWIDYDKPSDENIPNKCENAPINCPCRNCKKLIQFNYKLNLTISQAIQLVNQLKNLTSNMTKITIHNKSGHIIKIINKNLIVEIDNNYISIPLENVMVKNKYIL